MRLFLAALLVASSVQADEVNVAAASSLQDALRSYKERIDNYTLSLMKHELDATESDIRWLDDLIRSEQISVGRSLRPRRAARLAQRERT